jgi:hypothetical protein
MTKKIKYPKIEYMEDVDNYHYLTVITFRNTDFLCVVDNITDEAVSAYVFDGFKSDHLTTHDLLKVVNRWFYRNSSKHPLSFEFSKLNLTNHTKHLLKTFNLYEIQKIVGKPFIFDNGQKMRNGQ